MGGDFCTVPGMLSEPLRVQAGCGADCAVAGKRVLLCLARGHAAACGRCESLAHHSASFQLAVERCPTATPPLTATPGAPHALTSIRPPSGVCVRLRGASLPPFPLPHFLQMHRFILSCSALALVFGTDFSSARNVSLLLMRWAPSLDPHRGAAEGAGRVSPALFLSHPWVRCAGPVCRVHMLPAMMQCISSASCWR
ncbi:hypothetical protein GH5_08460 [Leishmania sp. Ghana 2012 LV757]|uniref:hypothetical protein n=1 Tax=Leishmania sp. Ghana 2012 LV757 TaxID=2803181 RepID=UPI001B67FE4B|nr:hypothetical protein GH5_08460 [Leishmania sp. Ghana 2012 LV757]